jgi:hypothetical protein
MVSALVLALLVLVPVAAADDFTSPSSRSSSRSS